VRIDPASLTAQEAASHIRQGLISSVDLVKACLARIEQTDGTIKAWAHLDAEQALEQAAEMDRIRRAGFAVGSLHGVPVGLKDIVDTADMPTERGTPIFAGRQPDSDAAIVERLRDAGAVIMGKTVTTELAFPQSQPYPQSAQSRADARRFFERIGRSGSSPSCAAGGWNPDQRLGHPSRILLRRLRFQAVKGCHLAPRHPADLGVTRSGRRLSPGRSEMWRCSRTRWAAMTRPIRQVLQGPGRPWPEARRKRRPWNPILPFSTCRFMIVLPATPAKV
jgi:hypothetical protein